MCDPVIGDMCHHTDGQAYRGYNAPKREPWSGWQARSAISATRPRGHRWAIQVASVRFHVRSVCDRPTETHLVFAEWVHQPPAPFGHHRLLFFLFLMDAIMSRLWAASPGGAGGDVRGPVAGAAGASPPAHGRRPLPAPLTSVWKVPGSGVCRGGGFPLRLTRGPMVSCPLSPDTTRRSLSLCSTAW